MVNTAQATTSTTAEEIAYDQQHHLPTEQDVNDYEREATELAHIKDDQGHQDPKQPNQASVQWRTKKQIRCENIRWYDPFVRWWRRYVDLAVPHIECRDHLGKSSQTVTM